MIVKNIKYLETIKCDDYQVYNLQYHKQRIADTIGININLEEYIYPISNKLLRCRVVYSSNGIESIEYIPYHKKQVKTFKLIYDDNIVYDKKYLNRTYLDNLYAQKDKYDEIIIIKDDLVTDTSIANIAIWYEDNWITPKCPLLYGTTRQRYIDNKILQEKNITVQMLKSASKIALLNAMIDFTEIDKMEIKC